MVRRQRGGSAAVAVNLAYKYGIPFMKKYGKQVLPLVLKRHGFQRGGVFRGKNRQRGRKNKKQKGGLLPGWIAVHKKQRGGFFPVDQLIKLGTRVLKASH